MTEPTKQRCGVTKGMIGLLVAEAVLILAAVIAVVVATSH